MVTQQLKGKSSLPQRDRISCHPHCQRFALCRRKFAQMRFLVFFLSEITIAGSQIFVTAQDAGISYTGALKILARRPFFPGHEHPPRADIPSIAPFALRSTGIRAVFLIGSNQRATANAKAQYQQRTLHIFHRHFQALKKEADRHKADPPCSHSYFPTSYANYQQ